jgi:plastocyanin
MEGLVLGLIQSYPVDGTYTFKWTLEPEATGVTRDLFYNGQLILAKQKGQACYCCGITFEVFHVLLEQLLAKNRIRFPLSVDAYKKFRKDWYCATQESDMERGVQKALVSTDLGTAIDIIDAQVGDFVQFWRKNGSGHSVIFLSHVEGTRGIKYWSSQNATNGIGTNIEYFDDCGGNVLRGRTYVARLKLDV